MGKGGLNRLLFTAEEAPSSSSPRVVTLPATDPRAVHIRTILRVSPGIPLRAAVSNECICSATVLSSAETSANESPLSLSLSDIEPTRPLPPVSLLLAMPRPRATRRAVRIASQLGVSCIVLTGAARVERSFFSAKLAHVDVLRQAVRDGVMQAAVDALVPEVHVQPRLWEAVRMVERDNDTRCVVLHPEGGCGIEEAVKDARRIVLAVGPEGGWMEEEVRFLCREGFVCAGMGERILATEVAIAVGITIAHQAMAKKGGRTVERGPALVGIDSGCERVVDG